MIESETDGNPDNVLVTVDTTEFGEESDSKGECTEGSDQESDDKASYVGNDQSTGMPVDMDYLLADDANSKVVFFRTNKAANDDGNGAKSSKG